jgi:hypothetical protein
VRISETSFSTPEIKVRPNSWSSKTK